VRTFLDIVNDMLAAGRDGDLITRYGYQEWLGEIEIDDLYADTLDLINF
jgi:hypothetical protein